MPLPSWYLPILTTRMAPQITPLQRIAIIALHKNGCRISEIEKRTGVSRNTVYFWLRRHKETGGNLIPRHRTTYKNSTTPEQDAAIVAAHLSQPNKSTSETASQFNISADTVRRRLRQATVKETKKKKHKSNPKNAKNYKVIKKPNINQESSELDVEQILSSVHVKMEFESDSEHGTDSIPKCEDLKKNMPCRLLEVCIDSLESALSAIHGGADELEVCSSLQEGGLTPSPGLVKEILVAVNNIYHQRAAHKTCPEECSCLKLKVPKVNVMLRCRAGSDFCYSLVEMETMLSDLEYFKAMQVDRFVFGALDKNQYIDAENCRMVIEGAAPIPVTFHRAFDVCADAVETLESLIQLGFNRLLTSGQATAVTEPEGLTMLEHLVNMFNDRIQIMPGAGITAANVGLLKNVPVTIFHGSCKMKRLLPEGLAMGSADKSYFYVTDTNEVRRLKQVLSYK